MKSHVVLTVRREMVSTKVSSPKNWTMLEKNVIFSVLFEVGLIIFCKRVLVVFLEIIQQLPILYVTYNTCCMAQTVLPDQTLT